MKNSKLKIFQPRGNSTKEIKKKLDDIYNDFSFNVTKIYQRKQIIMAADLVYHSVLHFNFLNRIIKKGWLECIIIGDTRCGKSTIVQNLTRHFKAGEFTTCGEHSSIEKILVLMKETKEGEWKIRWGKLVANNEGLIIFDEVDELKKKGIIKRLSNVRASGIAELLLCQAYTAMAQTRIIWIATPLHGKQMKKFDYAAESIKEIFETKPDISRIDFAVMANEEDIDIKKLTDQYNEKYPHKYTSELCHELIKFSWSRKINNIKFTKAAENLILKMATILGERYSSDIPLVTIPEMRVKFAKLSVALATRLYSVDSTGENVKVLYNHVLVIADMLEENYNNKLKKNIKKAKKEQQ